MHSRRILADDRKETLTTFSIFKRAIFESLGKRDDCREWRAQFVRNVREKLLPDDLETLHPRDIKENAERSFRAVSVCTPDRNHAQIEYLSLWSMCLDLHATAFDTFQTIKKRTVDRGIAREFSKSLRLQRSH